jgi:hypothetical protein
MPWSYWVAVAFVGSFGLLVVAVVISALLTRGSNPAGAILWGGLVYVTIWEYGFRRAYRVDLTDEELVWRSPFRAKRIPLVELAGATVEGRSGVLGEQNVYLPTASGQRLRLTVPNREHLRRVIGLFVSISERSQQFHVDGLPKILDLLKEGNIEWSAEPFDETVGRAVVLGNPLTLRTTSRHIAAPTVYIDGDVLAQLPAIPAGWNLVDQPQHET